MRVAALCAGVLGALGAAAPAHAATAQWGCSANAVTAQVAGMDKLNPITASSKPCQSKSVGLPNTTNAIGLAPTINAKTAYAVTTADPANARPIEQSIGSAAGVEGLTLQTADGTVAIGVGAAQSSAAAKCVNNKPVLVGDSHVTQLTINGQSVTVDKLLEGLTDAISNSPLGAVVDVKLNEQMKTADQITVNAAHIRVLKAVGTDPLADIVIAQSQVASQSACDPNADGNKPVGPSGPVVPPDVCPSGAALDTARLVCIIPAGQTGGQGEIVVGRPFTGPSGGRVISLTLARRRYKSPCLQGPGPKFVVIGTNKADRITGRNDADRILSLGGNDSVDGGRGNDCLDGGTGGDKLSGGIGADRLFGMSGRDALNGSSGNDRLSGGSGNDTINTAYGADRAYGGSGNDFINASTQGPKARTLNCGSGKADKVRVNKKEFNVPRSCETKYVLNDR